MSNQKLFRFQFVLLSVLQIVSGIGCSGEDFGSNPCVDGHSPRVHDASSLAVLPRRVSLSSHTIQSPGQPPQFISFYFKTQFAHDTHAIYRQLSNECEGFATNPISGALDTGLCVSVTVNDQEFSLVTNPFLPGEFSGSGRLDPFVWPQCRVSVFAASRVLFSTVIRGVLPPVYLGPIPTEGPPFGPPYILRVPAGEGVTLRWVPQPMGKIQILLSARSDAVGVREAVCIVPQALGEYAMPPDLWNFFPDREAPLVQLMAVEQRIEQNVLVESLSTAVAEFNLIRN